MIDDDIKAAWTRQAQYPSVTIPGVPTTYCYGYRDGRASVAGEVAEVLTALDALAWLHGDGILSKSARDRLRALL